MIIMDNWVKISLLLCVFGFLKEILPSESFVYEFMTGPWRNLTDDQVLKEVYPVVTYSGLILLILVFMITDMCRYKPLIIVLGLSQIAYYSMMLWTTTLFELQLTQVFFGMFKSCEVAYYTYIYAKVDSTHYQKVTSHTRAAILAGRTISGVSAQVLVSMNWMNYRQLNYVCVASATVGTIWALFLPSVGKSIYFHSEDAKELPLARKIVSAFTVMKSHLARAFTDLHVVKWSAWYSLSTCGYNQIEYYIQPLYSVVQNSDEDAYNGAVGAVATLLGFLGALLAGYLKIRWEITGELTLGIFSLMQGIFIATMSQSNYIFLCYSFYVLFGVLYHFMVTITSTQIARAVDEDSFGLIFGINMFVALVFNSILTALVATQGIGFALDPREQFIVYGSYHLVISLVFIVMGLRTCIVSRQWQDTEKNIVSSKNS